MNAFGFALWKLYRKMIFKKFEFCGKGTQYGNV